MKQILKRLFSFAVALVMVLGMVPFNGLQVYATTAPVVTTEAELKEALTAGGNVTLGDDINVAAQIEIPADKTVVLDLTGYDIIGGWNGTSTTNHIYVLSNRGTLTVKDSVGEGKIVSRGVYNYGSLTLESGTIDACDGNGGYAVNNESGSTFVMNGGVVSASYEDDYKNDQGGYDATALDVPAGCTATLNGGKVTSVTDFTFAIAAAGTLNVPETSTVVVEGNHGAISVSGGTTTVDGGTFKVIKDTHIRTDNVTYVSGGALIINGGKFIGDADSASGGCCVSDMAGGATINGGSFSGSSGGDVWGTTGTTITGGTFENLKETQHVTVGATIVNGGKTYTKTEDSLEEVVVVAKIGSTVYAAFADALTAAAAMTGDVTVEIYDKVTLNSSLSGSFDSIKFIGKSEAAEIYLDVQGYITATGKKVAFEDLILSKAQGGYITNAGFMNVAFGVYDVAEVTYTNCTFANGAYASSGEVTYNGCTFYRSWDKYGLWAYGNVDVTVDGCTFADYRGIKMYAEGAAKTVDLTVKNTDFSAVNDKPAIVLTYGESVTLENNTYSSTGAFELDLDGAPNGTAVSTDVYTITCKNDNGACGVLVDGKMYTTIAQAAEVATSGSKVILLYDPAETVELAEGVILDKNGYTAAGVSVAAPAVAKVGETKYADLHEAMVACKAGETVLLIADVNLAGTEWEPVSFKGTFDGQDHTISNLTINKPGVSSTGFITSLNGTIKNVTFTNPTVTGGENTGVIAGRAGGGAALAENITVNGTIKVETTHSGYARAAVIVGGWAYGNYKNITVDGGDKAVSYVKHTGGGDGRYVAGIVGHADDVESYVNCTVKNITISGGWLCGAIAGPGPAAGLASGCAVENVNMNADYSGGMFGWYYGDGTIKDSSIKNVAFTDGTTNNGAIGGYSANPDAKLDNVTIENVTNGDQALLEHVAKVNDTYYFSLQAALDAAVAGTGNVTVEILRDVNLTDVDWNPVTVSGPGYPLVTVNGNNKTITGLNDMLFAGTWAGKSGLIINDLTIANSIIVNDENDTKGTVGVGAFIGYPQASAIITLSNCHLVDSRVEGGHWTGGLIGMAGGYNGNDGPVFMKLTITDCSVTRSIITGKGSAGGVMGHGSCAAWTNVVIENTTVSSNTITSTGSSANKAGSVMGTIGAAGQPATANGETKTGGAFVSVTTSGNTVTSNGTTITTIYGRQGSSTGMLTVTGGTYEAYPIEENVSYAAPKSGYKIVENENGTYGLAQCEYVAQVGDKKFESLQAAVNAVQSGDTVTLLTDIALTEADCVANADRNVLIDVVGKDITLDMNGKKISVVHEDAFTNDYIVAVIRVGDGAGLTVTGDGEIDVKVLAGNPDMAYMFWKRGTTGHLTIENGTYHMNDSADSMVYTNGHEIVTVKGGKFTLDTTGTGENGSPWIFNVQGAGDHSVIVTGGTYNADINRQHWSNEAVVPKTHYVVKNSDNTWTVKEGAVAYVNEGMLTGPYFAPKDVGYATLQEALDAAKGEKDIVINLLDDVTLDITAWQTLAIGGETTETITINGNGKTLTFNKLNSDWNHVATNNDAKLILNDMTITDSGYNNGPWNRYDLNFACDVELNNVTSTKALAFKADATLNTVTVNETGDNYAIWIQANGQTVTIDGLTVTSAGRGIKIDNQYVDQAAKVTLSVSNATFNTAKKAAIMVKNPAGTDITVSNVDISNVAADTVNVVWNDEDNVDYYSLVNVTGGTKAQEGEFPAVVKDAEGNIRGYYKTIADAIAAAQNGDVIVVTADHELVYTGNEVDGLPVLVAVDGKSITIDLNGKKITGISGPADNTYYAAFAVDNDGSLTLKDSVGTGSVEITGESKMYSLLMAYEYGANETTKLIVEGGSYYLENAHDSLIFCGQRAKDLVYIKGGNFKLGNIGVGENGKPWTFNVVGSGDGCANVTGGTFNADINHQHWGNEAVVDKTCYVADNGDGTWTVKPGAVAYVDLGTLTGPYFVAKDFGFATLEEAFVAADDGNTITLLADIELTAGVSVPAGKTITLDLNGKTITGKPTEAKAFSVINNKGDLTIEGSGSVVCDHQLAGSTAYAVNTITNSGTLTIDGATIENKSTASNQIGYAIDNNSTTGDAVLVVKSGEVKASGSNYYDGIRLFCNNQTKENSVSVEGGTVSSIWLQNPSDGATEKDTKDVKGTVSITGGTVNALYLEPSSAFAAEITGGYVGKVAYFTTSEGRDLTHFITGGTFGMDVTAYCALGYQAAANTNGTYTVQYNESIVAWNMQTGAQYETVVSALLAAKENETVQLLKDSNEANAVLTVLNGITLDLNGHTLTAYYAITATVGSYIIDSTNGQGLLKVAKNNLVMADNTQLKIWMEEENGYRFAAVSFKTNLQSSETGEATFRFYLNEANGVVMKELADGATDNDGLTMQVKMTYTNSQGGISTLYFDFPADKIIEYAGKEYSGNASHLYMTIVNLDTVSDVSFAAVIRGGSVMIESAAVAYNG